MVTLPAELRCWRSSAISGIGLVGDPTRTGSLYIDNLHSAFVVFSSRFWRKAIFGEMCALSAGPAMDVSCPTFAGDMRDRTSTFRAASNTSAQPQTFDYAGGRAVLISSYRRLMVIYSNREICRGFRLWADHFRLNWPFKAGHHHARRPGTNNPTNTYQIEPQPAAQPFDPPAADEPRVRWSGAGVHLRLQP